MTIYSYQQVAAVWGLRKITPAALQRLAVQPYCRRRYALLGQICVSPTYEKLSKSLMKN